GPLPAGLNILVLNGNSLTPGFGLTCPAAKTYEMQVTFLVPGTYSFRLQAQDTSNQVIGYRTYTFVVTDFSGVLTTTLNTGSVGAPYSEQLSAFGGNNVQWVLAPGSALPPGNPAFSISPSGLLTGKPTVAGTYIFTANFSDAS